MKRSEINKNFNLRNNPNNINSHNPANTQQFIYYAILVLFLPQKLVERAKVQLFFEFSIIFH